MNTYLSVYPWLPQFHPWIGGQSQLQDMLIPEHKNKSIQANVPRSFRTMPYSSAASCISSIARVLRASKKAEDGSDPSSMFSGPKERCLTIDE